jgi:transcription initiation factor TFIIIB Brf1 subunit/transcription initiation factor TFIIB
MTHQHKLMTERGETYCTTCGEVLGYEMVSSFPKKHTQDRFKNNTL